MGTYRYILFDLDGTLTDSGPGIMHGFLYAIRKMGRHVPESGQLEKFVGPPLKDSFHRVLGYSEEDTDKAVALYREYYNTMGGVYENRLYPGIAGLLRDLKAAGKILIVATSKSAYATNKVLEHFDLKKYFALVEAADDRIRPRKADVINYALDRCGVSDRSQAVMVGDRENDITAAKEAGIDSIGVLYGYGDREELTAAGATYLAESASDIRTLADQPDLKR